MIKRSSLVTSNFWYMLDLLGKICRVKIISDEKKNEKENEYAYHIPWAHMYCLIKRSKHCKQQYISLCVWEMNSIFNYATYLMKFHKI